MSKMTMVNLFFNKELYIHNKFVIEKWFNSRHLMQKTRKNQV